MNRYDLLDSAWLYTARTIGVLALLLYLAARAVVCERLRLVFDR